MSDHPYQTSAGSVALPARSVMRVDDVGARCVDERMAGRPVPHLARVSPAQFWAWVRKLDAKVFPGDYFDVATPVGMIRVRADPGVGFGDVVYEVPA